MSVSRRGINVMYSSFDQQRTWKLIILSVIVHTLILFGVMNIYFTSPVEHGMPSHRSEAKPLAKRVVIFLSDGLRAEGIFHPKHEHRAPYLKHVRLHRGAWGISHTQVPTESRPGHVAIFAGMYEDPSAVMEGWQHNPIDFDHVFNQSKNSWLWGSPDIVPMFNREKNSKIHTDSYNPEFEKFSGSQDTRLLDSWVFDRVKKFMKQQKLTHCKEFCEEGNVFFLHLLGLDTVGHVHKPNSEQYVSNIEFVDQAIKEVELIFEDFFRDKATSYIFTSDHGMTDWGSHGSGTLFETQSPLIAWGSGILPNNKQNDLMQADITPLISTLIGINIPVNSVGVLPDSYLNLTDEQHAHALFANVLQLGEQYNVKRLKMEKNILPLFFKPFIKLIGSDYYHFVDVIKYNLKTRNFDAAIQGSGELLNLVQEGLLYYKNYYKFPLLLCLASGLLLWVLYLGMSIVNFDADDKRKNHKVQHRNITQSICYILITIALIWLTLYCQSVEYKFYFYFTFPFAVLVLIILEAEQLTHTWRIINSYGFMKFIVVSVLYIMGIEILVMAFFHRAFISLALIGLVGWVFLQSKTHIFWGILCFGAALFPLLPPLSLAITYKYSLLALIVWWYILIVTLMNQLSSVKPHKLLFITGNLLQFCVVNIAGVLLWWITVSFKKQLPVSDFIYNSAWISLFTSLITMHASPRFLITRTFMITNSLLTIYLLMSFSYEGFFLIWFIILLNQWCYTESGHSFVNYVERLHMRFDVNMDGYRSNRAADFRRGFFFITFILLSYFGSGNIADLNSFDPMWVRCFISVFSPFTMTGLIIFKITIPFLLTTVCFRVINVLTGARMVNMFTIVLLFCDLLVINFMFLVRNEGSWLEIGLSISRFSITIAMTIVLLLFYVIAYFVTCSPFYDWIYQIINVNTN